MLSQSSTTVGGLPCIPAMTTDAERECYYRLVRAGAGQGAIVELGAWMGASTAYIAAGIRDSGVPTKAHVYDKFQEQPGHARKVNDFFCNRGLEPRAAEPSLETLRHNLGPLIEFVVPHKGKIENLVWGTEPISVLISDAPKRVPQIASVLTKFCAALGPGSIMAWQDFCHFPSYEIPACLYRLKHHLEFLEAVVPGTTMVFGVRSSWTENEVSPNALALNAWSVDEVDLAWDYWADFVHPDKLALFDCGAAMFLCDIGEAEEAVERLARIHARDASSISKKWNYLREQRPDFLVRYAPLFHYLEQQRVFDQAA